MCCSVCEWMTRPISPSSPATKPAPKIISVPIPFAIGERTTEPASASAAMITTAPATSSPGATIRSGSHEPAQSVMPSAAK